MSLPIDIKTKDNFQVEEDRVILFDQLAQDVIYDMMEFPDAPEEIIARFKDEFEVLGDEFMSDPNESFYQGISFITVIKRKRDGRLFGYVFWRPVAKHAEPYLDNNAEEHGFDWEVPDGHDWDEDYYPEAYVFLPVEPFTITGYQIAKTS